MRNCSTKVTRPSPTPSQKRGCARARVCLCRRTWAMGWVLVPSGELAPGFPSLSGCESTPKAQNLFPAGRKKAVQKIVCPGYQ